MRLSRSGYHDSEGLEARQGRAGLSQVQGEVENHDIEQAIVPCAEASQKDGVLV